MTAAAEEQNTLGDDLRYPGAQKVSQYSQQASFVCDRVEHLHPAQNRWQMNMISQTLSLQIRGEFEFEAQGLLFAEPGTANGVGKRTHFRITYLREAGK
jgi:hypothetical protein